MLIIENIGNIGNFETVFTTLEFEKGRHQLTWTSKMFFILYFISKIYFIGYLYSMVLFISSI